VCETGPDELEDGSQSSAVHSTDLLNLYSDSNRRFSTSLIITTLRMRVKCFWSSHSYPLVGWFIYTYFTHVFHQKNARCCIVFDNVCLKNANDQKTKR